MREFEFTLKFALTDTSKDASCYVELLGEAGCNDALVGIGQKGRIAFAFCREAESAYQAVLSAIKNIKSVIPDAELIEATPDMVGISDIADLLGLTRQNLRELVLNHSTTFPTAIHDGNSAIWHLANVLTWFKQGKRKIIEPSLMEIANANMQLNIAKETKNLDPLVQSEFFSVLT
ncbi:DNA-binding protein [Candidatus Thiomargarita nelsonii]|uniref:DNA-binding protein n=1 Tax=Candidatus Thiomargarita nelsonii TaxID=1003181 RepID=A0A0A6PNZ3_9GAMM|nr:DNA-binding protein [Candidatus Thiomargarita nelsonii]